MKNYSIHLSSIFSKCTQPQVPSSSVRRGLDADVWSVILLKVDPYCIFKCILVCKEWLEVITSSFFRMKYLKKWKHSFPVIGFMCKFLWFELVMTNKLGSLINKTKLMSISSKFQFISKSSSGDGLILCRDLEKNMFYVFNLAARAGAIVTTLPPPPVYSSSPFMEIISEDTSFKVIILDVVLYGEVTKVNIQTFCSSTSMWDKSDSFCGEKFSFTPMPKIASSRGVVYFPTDSFTLIAYDTNNNNQQQCVRVIPALNYREEYIRSTYYVVSPEGNLHCARTHVRAIKIWVLNENEEDCKWKFLYMMDLKDLEKMSKLKGPSYSSRFRFVSFVPGRSYSIFVACDRYNFIYNADTQLLERFEDTPSFNRYIHGEHHIPLTTFSWYIHGGHHIPLTTAELGVWPSSPFSNHPTPNKPRSFKLLGYV